MRLDSVYARFFRSLNFDYIRQSAPGYAADPWDGTPNAADYPFVRLRLEADITTIVGANESGKSQVLDAIEAALTGEGFDRSDFCRYSPFFAVDKDLIRPEFGVVFAEITAADLKLITELCDGLEKPVRADRVAVFRMNSTPQRRLYLRNNGEWSPPALIRKPTILDELGLPAVYRIESDTALPDSVPLQFLATGKPTAGIGRALVRGVWDMFTSNPGWFESDTSVGSAAADIAAAFKDKRELDEHELARFALAEDLLITVAGLQRDLFVELQGAVRTKNGYANSIVDTINAELARSLNFPSWWSQDSQFELFVSLFEYDLVFMIRDRTGRSYGFDERSDGLKYFLSYYVRYRAHADRADGRPEILLMDEPDKFLSSSGQQDLLRIFASFADPDDGKRPVQVVYVTHSPFLIDKNHSERIRVLEKGEFDEGTRLVASVAQNHYEPLRSAFGSFVGETTFIGNCNLVLEGPSDQILLAGISSWMGRRGVPTLDRLDLNAITLVPAGSASHVPYLVYLARGRDVDKPPLIVLLDGDEAGREARATIKRGGARRKALISDELVVQLGDPEVADVRSDNPAGGVTIEDLIPVGIALEAAGVYCEEFVPDVHVAALGLNGADLFAQTEGKSLLAVIEAAVANAADEPAFHLDKIAFARSVLAVLNQRPADDPDSAIVEANFRVLLRELGRRQRKAVKAESSEKISSRIKRTHERFIRSHPDGARREHAVLLIEEIEGQLDDSAEAEQLRVTMRGWQNDFKLAEDPRKSVEDFPAFLHAISALTYQAVRESETVPSGSG